MARKTFIWGHLRKAGAVGKTSFRTNTAQFGDGYQQRSSGGLNNRSQSWPLQFEGSEAELAPILEFFDEHAGVRAFYWTPPSAPAPRLWIVDTYNYISVGAGLYSVSADFKEVFAP